MVNRYLIDSSAVSQYLEARMPESGLLFMDNVFAIESNISVITQIELLTWQPPAAELGEKITIYIDDSTVFELTPSVVAETIRLRRKHRIKTPDAIIAATALVNGFQLITDNERDFSSIKGLRVINPNRL
ncbi:type II toxin-antitoxin system VapC family toxin [Fibrella sp. WM1]|uniref:type II toxin-antitoxin system VapC family toxin n=1 Tax=Fibrella musci TaxID=3242485 RepID=UPI003521DF74